jgi:hypothetical protein
MKINIYEQLENPEASFDKEPLVHTTNRALLTLLDKVKEMADAIRYEMYRRNIISKEEYSSLKEKDSL